MTRPSRLGRGAFLAGTTGPLAAGLGRPSAAAEDHSGDRFLSECAMSRRAMGARPTDRRRSRRHASQHFIPEGVTPAVAPSDTPATA